MMRHRPAPRRADRRPSEHRTPAGVAIAALLAAIQLATAPPAGAVRGPEAPTGAAFSAPGVGAVSLAGPERRRALSRGTAWREFTSRHGDWTALWNARTATPHRAFGPPIPLPGFTDRPQAVEAALRAFIAGHPGLFGTPTLVTERVQKVRGTWYVSFRQTVRGMPVLFGDWEFRVGANGNLFAFGADLFRVTDAEVVPGPRLPAAVAREAARAGLRFAPGRDRVEGGETLALLPVAAEGGLTYRVVTEARVVTAEPPGDWRTLVDAATGEILWRQDLVRHAISGTVTGTVHPSLPTEPLVARPLANLTVQVGPNAATTGPTGAYGAPAVGNVTVSAQLLGPWCNVNRQDAVPDASFSAPATDPATVDIAFHSGNSHDAERDAFYHVNVVHDYIKALDPGATGVDYMAPCNVNINNTCNAFFSTVNGSVNFYLAGGGCPNTATMPDVVYHEYGHLVNHEIYQQAGQASGMTNGALHEGLADVLAAMIQDHPDGGKGFFGPGTILRSIDNTRKWPQDASSDGHVTGLIIGGAFWDLRQSAGLAVAAQLSHFAKYGIPDDGDDGVAMNEYFIETLVADDDDDDLSNGTPHGAEIIAAFNGHGIGTGFFMDVGHAPLADQPGSGPYPVTATAAYSGPIGALAGTPTLYYRFNSDAYQALPMTPTGNPDEYTASIPGTYAAVVSYYVSAGDTYGGVTNDPPGAPDDAHRFIAGPAEVLASLDMETDPGWTAGAAGDDAITGLWLRADPVGSQVTAGIYVQPEDDHTPAGIQCWVTGNAPVLAGAGTNDVDGGRTTLLSALLDAAPLTGASATATGVVEPVISYYRWYTNNQGASPGSDLWRVDISNDGGLNWVSVESTTQSDASWKRIVFRIADYVVPTSQVRLRFIAEDAGAGSLVEAAVDDLELLAFPDVVAVGDPPGPAGLALALASAHPAPGTLRLSYTLANAGPVSLRIYDVGGRAVRTLVEGPAEAGRHAAAWDGRDDGGAPLPSGTYFARLATAGSVVTRTLVRAR